MQYSQLSHFFSEINISPIKAIPVDAKHSLSVDIKRDDRLHSVVSGNKWRKLKYLLLFIESKGYKSVAAMGGPYSNFLHSLAFVSYCLGWKCHLYIRGYAEQELTPTLKDCCAWGAKITFVNRLQFREIRSCPPPLSEDTYWITEGGLSHYAMLGMEEVFMEVAGQFDYIISASATGTTVAGLAKAALRYQPQAQIIGISVLNNAQQQSDEVERLIGRKCKNWLIMKGFEQGGFAKSNESVTNFIANFENTHRIPLEPVYSGKSFLATQKLADDGYFFPGARVLLIHCGGLQGKRS